MIKSRYGGNSYIQKRDWLLIIGLILSPMTGLRIGKIGPAEVLCLIWGSNYFLRMKIQINDLVRFFIVFLSSMLLGTMWCLMVSPKEVVMSHWATWIYLAVIAITMYDGLVRNTVEYNLKLFDLFARGAALWYLFLYIYSITVSKRIFGAPLWYAGFRFTGGATNPHQVAVLMCGLTFCFMRYVLQGQKPLVNLLFAGICVYIELQTAASTGTAALVISSAVMLFIIVGHVVPVESDRTLIYIIEIMLIITIGLLWFGDFYRSIYGWISSDRNGLGRLNLIRQIGISFRKSPIFGLGPGVHAFDMRNFPKEYHNTYLEIIAASGIVGISAFVDLTVRTVKNMMADDLFIPVLIAIYSYGFGGFAMRRLAYWGIFVFIFVISEQRNYY